MRPRKRTKTIMARSVRRFTAIGLASLLTGCATPCGKPAGGSSLNDSEANAPGQIDTGLYDYRQILSDPGPS